MQIVYDDKANWDPRCMAQHIGNWLIEPSYLKTRLAALQSTGFAPQVNVAQGQERASQLYGVQNGIAFISIAGSMMKSDSKYNDVTNTVRVRRAIRTARVASDVRGVMLVVDSPGGTVAGTYELAEDLWQFAMTKPLHVYVEDMAASAAYWASCQADRITANETALVGSIGTYAVIEDWSAFAEKKGVKVHVLSTGPHKGAFIDGTEAEPHQLAEAQNMVNSINRHFTDAVLGARNIRNKEEVFSGKVFIAAEAKRLGLIDAIGTIDSAIAALAKVVSTKQPAVPKKSETDTDVARRIAEAKSYVNRVI